MISTNAHDAAVEKPRVHTKINKINFAAASLPSTFQLQCAMDFYRRRLAILQLSLIFILFSKAIQCSNSIPNCLRIALQNNFNENYHSPDFKKCCIISESFMAPPIKFYCDIALNEWANLNNFAEKRKAGLFSWYEKCTEKFQKQSSQLQLLSVLPPDEMWQLKECCQNSNLGIKYDLRDSVCERVNEINILPAFEEIPDSPIIDPMNFLQQYSPQLMKQPSFPNFDDIFAFPEFLSEAAPIREPAVRTQFSPAQKIVPFESQLEEILPQKKHFFSKNNPQIPHIAILDAFGEEHRELNTEKIIAAFFSHSPRNCRVCGQTVAPAEFKYHCSEHIDEFFYENLFCAFLDKSISYLSCDGEFLAKFLKKYLNDLLQIAPKNLQNL